MKTSVVIDMVDFLNTNFSINMDSDKIEAYARLVKKFMERNGVEEKQFVNAVGAFIEKTKGSNFNKLPSVGDFLDILGILPKSVEEKARNACELVFSNIETIDTQSRVIFDDVITNYVLKSYIGGISQFIWDNCKRNESRRDTTWAKKDFINSYISAHDMGCHSVEPLRLSNSFSRFGSKMIGDKIKCEENIKLFEEQKLLIENRKTNKELERLTTTFKK